LKNSYENALILLDKSKRQQRQKISHQKTRWQHSKKNREHHLSKIQLTLGCIKGRIRENRITGATGNRRTSQGAGRVDERRSAAG
jgi:hypothetical protein